MHSFYALLFVLYAQHCGASPSVVVYGSTPAGIAASIAAARGGAAVTLVDPSPRVGGMCSGGLGSTDVGIEYAIGGIAHEFFTEVGRAYGESSPVYKFEPSVAEAVFLSMLSKTPNVTRVRSGAVSSVTMHGTAIASFSTSDGQLFGFDGSVFVDASYEGDVTRAAGATTVFGREPAAQYNESWGGRREPFQGPFDYLPFSPLSLDGSLLPLLTTRISAPLGSGDAHVQGYNYRLCATQAANRLPFPPPKAYNASQWEVLRRMSHVTDPDFTHYAGPVALPHGKYDLNNGALISTDATGFGWAWPSASPSQRVTIADSIREYMLSFFHTLATDSALPSALRSSTATWGLCADEFVSNAGWPEQLYVREASRVVGDRVLIQSDLWPDATSWGLSSIGMGSYAADGHYSTRGPCIREQGRLGGCAMATSEAQITAAAAAGTLYTGGEGYVGATNAPALYQLPYWVLLPKRGEVTNLLCPTTPSTSHVTFASLRVEPQFLILGHAAGEAAALAARAGTPVQDVPAAALRARLVAGGAVLCKHGAPACDTARREGGW